MLGEAAWIVVMLVDGHSQDQDGGHSLLGQAPGRFDDAHYMEANSSRKLKKSDSVFNGSNRLPS